MPFDGNGNWTSNFSAVADRNANIKIEASRFDNILLADIAQSFETCLTKDMQVKPQQNFDANNFRLINVADPVIGSDAVNLSTLNTKDGTAVHKAGTETITGAKTFSGNITSSGTNTFSGDNTFSNTITGSISGNAGTVTNGVYTTGNQTIAGDKTLTGSTTLSGNLSSSGTNTFSGSNTFTGSVSLGSSATATTKSSGTSDTSVATTEFVQNADSLAVHKSGNEEITGIKTVTAHWNFKTEQTISNTYVTKGTNPTNAQYTTLAFCDKNGTGFSANQLGNVQHRLDTDGTSLTSLTVIKNDANSTSTASVGVACKNDGTKYGYAPTPSSVTDNSTKIATTAWIKNAINTGNLGIPDLSSRVSVTSPYTPTVNGILRVYQSGNAPNAWINTTINDSTLWLARAESRDGERGAECVWCVVEKGRTYNFGENKGTLTVIFIPFK